MPCERILDAVEPVGTELIVRSLQEVPDLLAREVLRDVLTEDLAFDGVVRLPSEGVGILRHVVPAVAARGDEQVRHVLGLLMYFTTARCVGVPSAWKIANTLSWRISLCVCVDVLVGLYWSSRNV